VGSSGSRAEGCRTASTPARQRNERNRTVIERIEVSTPFSQAATRMFGDAEALHSAGRLGTPDHLYGLACECALKAVLCGHGVIRGTAPQSPFKVHIDKLWDEYETALQGRTMLPLGPNPFTGWQAQDRYEEDSVFLPQRVATHRNGAVIGMSALQAAAAQGFVS
jgi:hypothetical protein